MKLAWLANVYEMLRLKEGPESLIWSSVIFVPHLHKSIDSDQGGKVLGGGGRKSQIHSIIRNLCKIILWCGCIWVFVSQIFTPISLGSILQQRIILWCWCYRTWTCMLATIQMIMQMELMRPIMQSWNAQSFKILVLGNPTIINAVTYYLFRENN